MHIREAIPTDAAAVIALFDKLYGETNFLLYAPGEATPDEQEYARRIAEVAAKDKGVMFVAEADAELIGVIFGNRGTAKKSLHTLFLVMGVLQAWSGRGVGRALLKAIEGWAVAKGLHRLELTVRETNHRAVLLYERAGFEREGLKRHSLRIGNEYANELLMSKLIVA